MTIVFSNSIIDFFVDLSAAIDAAGHLTTPTYSIGHGLFVRKYGPDLPKVARKSIGKPVGFNLVASHRRGPEQRRPASPMTRLE